MGTAGTVGTYNTAMEKKLTVKCTEAELVAWKDAAYVRRVSLSEWVRRVLSATAERTKEGGSE